MAGVSGEPRRTSGGVYSRVQREEPVASSRSALPRSASLAVPVMAVQTTFSNEKRERTTMRLGQSSPYLDMFRACVPSGRIEVIADTGHFPQLDTSAELNAWIDSFLMESVRPAA